VIQIVTVILGGSDTTRTAMAVQVALLAGDPPLLQGHSGIRRISPMHVAWD
jgi:cytochrome P450